MSLKRQFIESFVQGLGRTSAAFVVFGVLTGIFYLSTEKPQTRESSIQTSCDGVDVEHKETDSPSFILLKDDNDDIQPNFQKLLDMALSS